MLIEPRALNGWAAKRVDGLPSRRDVDGIMFNLTFLALNLNNVPAFTSIDYVNAVTWRTFLYKNFHVVLNSTMYSPLR